MMYEGFEISHDGSSTVTVRKSNVSLENFHNEVVQGRRILRVFRQSRPGSEWGCDGVGFEIQRKAGDVRINKSGVGIRKFQAGLKTLETINA